MEKLEYCYTCDKDVMPIIKKENNEYTFRGKTFTTNEGVKYCPYCHSELLSKDLDDYMINIYNSYLSLYNLSLEDIKNIRTNLNLSQEVFSKILGWSKKSIVRYENNESIPQGEYLNTYMLLKDNPYYIVKILEKKKDLFSKDEYYKIINNLPFKDMYKTINTILFILYKNTLCETSLMKNLFTIDFYNYKENNSSITNLKYAHLPYGPVVDNRNSLYNFMLRNNYLKLEITENSVNFIAGVLYDRDLFSEDEFTNMKFIKDKLSNYTSNQLSDWTHNFKGYIDTKNGDIIGYNYAKYLDIDSL